MAFLGLTRRVMRMTAAAGILMVGAACGGSPAPLANPLQSTLPTPTRPAPTPMPTQPPAPATRAPTPARANASAATPNPKASPAIVLTPGFQGTSQAVILTITAQYFSPTPPPTPTRRAGSTGAGAGSAERVATSTPVSGLVVATFSERVTPGGAASLEIRTAPNVLCTISQKQGENWQPAPNAPARVSGSDGSAAWVWTIDPATPRGGLALFVDCGESRNINLTMQVEK